MKRYYGDAEVTKSVMEVWMQGEREPRMVCEAREAGFVDYAESFPGASRVCLPRGRWRMKVGRSPYGPMGLRVARCPGHRCVYVGHRWARQLMEGEVLIGESLEGGLEEMRERRIENGEVVFGRLTELVYEAYGRGEEYWMEIDNECLETVQG